MKVAIDQATASHALLVYLGDRLGLWKTLASVHSATSAQLAQRSGLAERCVREWLSAQAAGGYLEYDADRGTFSLPAEHAMVLADDDTPATQVAGFEVTAAMWASADRLAHAYATGEGVGGTSTTRACSPAWTASSAASTAAPCSPRGCRRWTA